MQFSPNTSQIVQYFKQNDYAWWSCNANCKWYWNIFACYLIVTQYSNNPGGWLIGLQRLCSIFSLGSNTFIGGTWHGHTLMAPMWHLWTHWEYHIIGLGTFNVPKCITHSYKLKNTKYSLVETFCSHVRMCVPKCVHCNMLIVITFYQDNWIIQFACMEIETINVDLHCTNMCSSSLCVLLNFEWNWTNWLWWKWTTL
jgi:hypothetical protein